MKEQDYALRIAEARERYTKISQRDYTIKDDELANLHSIIVDGKKVDKSMGLVFDQVVSLSKSTLWDNVIKTMSLYMAKYYELPSEEQVRETPKEVKKELTALIKRMGDTLVDTKSGKSLMLINDEAPITVRNVIDIDSIKAEMGKVISTSKYGNISDVMKDKSLSYQEKREKMDKILEQKYAQSSPIINLENDDDDDEGIDVDDIEIPIVDDTLIEHTPREIFLSLCKKYPKNFENVNSGMGSKVGWLRQKHNRTYVPTLITLNKEKAQAYIDELKVDSTTTYIPNSYFVKDMNAYVEFVRTSKDF